MVHIATEKDAEQLEILNNEFNGEGETMLENIRTITAKGSAENFLHWSKMKLNGLVIPLFKSKPSRWADTRFMMTPTVSTFRWGSKNWKFSQHCGMSATPAKFI